MLSEVQAAKCRTDRDAQPASLDRHVQEQGHSIYCVERFLPPEVHRRRATGGKVVIKPNFVDFAAPQVSERDGFLFVGRLSAEKGTGILSEAALQVPEVCLRIAGTGPEAHQLQGLPNAKMLGALGGEEVRLQMEAATALVLPSIWYENFPRTLVEAFAAGLPVIGSRLGALEELIEDGVTGLLFEPGNADELASKIRWAHSNAAAMAEMGRRARAHYENNFTATKNYEQLISIYEEAIIAARSE